MRPSSGNMATRDWETDAFGNKVSGILGLPTSDEKPVPGVPGGRMNSFQGGDIYWSVTTGRHVVYGAIGAKYNSLGGPNSYMGYPTSDMQGAGDGKGFYNTFQHGSLYWSPTPGVGAHEIEGGILAKWVSMGGPNSYMGYPTSDMQGAGDGKGFITPSSTASRCTVADTRRRCPRNRGRHLSEVALHGWAHSALAILRMICRTRRMASITILFNTAHSTGRRAGILPITNVPGAIVP